MVKQASINEGISGPTLDYSGNSPVCFLGPQAIPVLGPLEFPRESERASRASQELSMESAAPVERIAGQLIAKGWSALS